MPTYEYECQACGGNFEIFQKITDSPKRKCPSCGKPKLKRLIGSGGGFLFRGSGFYITDYRSSEYQAKAKAESEGGGKKESPQGGSGGGGKKEGGEGTAKKTELASAAKE